MVDKNNFTPWEPIESKIFYQNNWRTYKEDIFYDPSGNKRTYAYRYHEGGALIIPMIRDNTFILLQNYRYLVGDISLEFPRGAMKPEETDLVETASNELEEETGYRAGSIIELGQYYVNNSTTNDYPRVFLATDLTKGIQKLDTTEEDEIRGIIELTHAEINKKIATGEITDGFTIIGLKYYELYLQATS